MTFIELPIVPIRRRSRREDLTRIDQHASRVSISHCEVRVRFQRRTRLPIISASGFVVVGNSSSVPGAGSRPNSRRMRSAAPAVSDTRGARPRRIGESPRRVRHHPYGEGATAGLAATISRKRTTEYCAASYTSDGRGPILTSSTPSVTVRTPAQTGPPKRGAGRFASRVPRCPSALR